MENEIKKNNLDKKINNLNKEINIPNKITNNSDRKTNNSDNRKNNINNRKNNPDNKKNNSDNKKNNPNNKKNIIQYNSIQSDMNIKNKFSITIKDNKISNLNKLEIKSKKFNQIDSITNNKLSAFIFFIDNTEIFFFKPDNFSDIYLVNKNISISKIYLLFCYNKNNNTSEIDSVFENNNNISNILDKI